MKICMVISTPFPPEEGIGYYTYNLSKKLIEKGHKVIVITRGSWNKTQKEKIEEIEVIKAPFLPIYPFYIYLHGFFVNKIFKSLESQIDIVHLHSPLPPLIKTSRPIITTIHTPMLTDYRQTRITSFHSLFSKISAKLVSYPQELKLIEASDIITTVSNPVAQELKEYNIKPSELIITGNGVDEKFFNYKQKKPEGNIKYIMFAGRIDREKGLFDLVECGRYISKERSDVRFIIAGKGRDFNKLKKKIKKIGLQDKFILTGQVNKNQLVKLYQNATIFILPSYHEGLPSVVLEAMSCGLPVIVTDVRGNRELISNGETGIVIPPRSPKKMAKTISTLLDDEKLRKKLGENARKIIEKNYTWDKISNKFLECYKSTVKESS